MSKTHQYSELKEATAKAIDKISSSSASKDIIKALKELKSNFGHNNIGLPVSNGVILSIKMK